MLLGAEGPIRATTAFLTRAMAGVLDLLRWPNFVSDEDFGQAGTEGKFGIPRFNGEATRLSEYKFRVQARIMKEKALTKEEREKLGPLGLRLIEGLSGTALRLAQTMSMEDLGKEDGANKLVDIFEKALRPKRMQQARELYQAGSSPHGLLSRQQGEPISTYVLRRRTWYRCLVDCSAEMSLPDMVLAEQLLASAGISQDHQLLVRTALKGEISFDAVADELVAQHGRIHERERKGPHHRGPSHKGGHGKPWSTGARTWRPTGYLAEYPAETDQDYHDDPAEANEEDEPDLGELTIAEEHVGYFVEDGLDLEDNDTAEHAAELVQAEQEAYMARKGAAGKGGFRPPPARQFAVSGSLSLEERRQKVADLKSRTTCRRCGQRGHWSGDAACPQTKGAGRAGKTRPGTTPPSSSSGKPDNKGTGKGSKQRPVYFAIREEPGEHHRQGMMAYRAGRGYHAVPPPRDLGGPPSGVIDLEEDDSPANTTAWSLVPAETRPQWTDLPGQHSMVRAEDRANWTDLPPPGPTQSEIEDLMLQEALGKMEVDAPVAPEPLEDHRPPVAAQGPPSTPPRTTSTSTPPTSTARPSTRTPCPHHRTTTKGSNAHVRQVRCLDCGELLEKKKLGEISAPTAERRPPGPGICRHNRVSWKGTNAFAWRRTCLDCGHLETGTSASKPAKGVSMGSSSAASRRTVPDEDPEEEIYMTKEEVERAVSTFSTAVQIRMAEVGPANYIRGSTLRESLKHILRMVTVFNEPRQQPSMQEASPYRMAPGSSTQAGSTTPTGHEEHRRQLQERGHTLATEGKYKGQAVYQAYRDTGYRNWVRDNIDEHSGRGMKQLKNAMKEFADYEAAFGELYQEHRVAYMVAPPAEEEPLGAETSLVAVLDTGCNTTCHGERWMRRFLTLTRQPAPTLRPDNGGGFKGIGGHIGTTGVRDLKLCLELSDGGHAEGELRSVEIEGSDAPLLVSLEAQRRLGLVLDLNREIAHSQLLGRDLRLVHHNGLFGLRLLPGDLAHFACEDHPENPDNPADDQEDTVGNHNPADHSDHTNHHQDESDDNNTGEEPLALGYLAFDGMKTHAMSKGQATRHKENLDNVKGKDKLLWNQVCPYNLRRRPCVPRGCRTFLLEVFGCAMLTGVLHHGYGYPVSMPIGTGHGTNFDLTTLEGRAKATETINHDDPYLLCLSPGPEPTEDNMPEKDLNNHNPQRKQWLHMIRWMCDTMLDRLKKGRQVLLAHPSRSSLWNTWDIKKLLGDPEAMDTSSLEPLEKIGLETAGGATTGNKHDSYHKKPVTLVKEQNKFDISTSGNNDSYRKKPVTLVTSSSRLKHVVWGASTHDLHGQPQLCGFAGLGPDGFWTQHLCETVADAHIKDLGNLMVRTAFPAEAEQETGSDEPGEVMPPLLDAIYEDRDRATGRPTGMDLDEQALQDAEKQLDHLEGEESSGMKDQRAKWRKLPEATRIAVRRLHTMTGHASVSSMQRLLRTAGGDPEVIKALPHFHCPACSQIKKPEPRPSTRAASDYRFNVEVALDCFEVRDVARNRYTILSAVCMGTLFHTAAVVSEVGGVPSSARCLETFKKMWLDWAGPPSRLVLDRGTHNRGIFAETVTSMGTLLRFVGTEAAHQLGRGERQGGILKSILQHVIENRQLSTLAEIEMLIPEATFIKNNRVHHGGFTPAQWTLGRMPLEVDSLVSEESSRYLGTHEEALDPETAFGRQLQLRVAAKEAFSYQDSSQRVRAAMLRRSAPQRGPYAPGDLVCFFRKTRGTTTKGRWLGPARILGIEGRSLAWLIHGGIPITASLESLRYATGGEIAAKRELELRPSRKRRRDLMEPDEELEYPFGDDLAGSPTARTTDDHAHQVPFFNSEDPELGEYSPDLADEEHNRQNEETPAALPPPPGLPEPTGELRRDLPPVPEGDDSDLNSMNEEPEGEMVPPSLPESRRDSSTETELGPNTGSGAAMQINPSTARPGSTGGLLHAMRQSVDQLDGVPRGGVSRAPSSGREGRSRSPPPAAPRSDREDPFVGFLARRNNKKTVAARMKELCLRKSSEERQEKMLEARRKEWANWTGFNATTVLKPSSAQEFLRSNPGTKVVPTRWVDTLKSQPWEPDRHKARLVVRGDLEDDENLRTDSPTCSQAMLNYTLALAAGRRWPVKGGDITAAFLQGEGITRQLVLSLPSDGVEGVEPGSLMIAHKPVYGTKDAPRGFWKKLKQDRPQARAEGRAL